MNIRKLEIFYATATTLNMTRVAKELYISQPSVSQAIKEVEEEVGTLLFDRIGKKLYLTHEGETYLHYVRRILNLYKEATEQLAESATKQKGKIRIGASTTIGIYLLPSILSKFAEAYEGIEIALTIDNTAKIEELLLENKIDIAYVEGEVISEELVKHTVWKDEIIFICSTQNPLSKKEIIEAYNLQEEKLIMREKGSGTREIAEKYMDAYGITYKTYMELGDNEAIKHCVKAGLGIGCLSSLCVEERKESEGLAILRLEEASIERDLYLIYHKDKFISNNLKSFITFVYRQ